MPSRGAPQRRRRGFQSTPGFAAGRCPRVWPLQGRPIGFNPRPALQPGDAGVHREKATRPAGVSIHARLCSRAMRDLLDVIGRDYLVSIHARLCSRAMQMKTPYLPSSGCFNPRPALQPGDATAWRQPDGRAQVSIHARLCSRAMPPVWVYIECPEGFQSTPGFAAGRCRPSASPIRRTNEDVSIHARLCSRAMRPVQAELRAGHGVSFNPRPALQPGDAGAASAQLPLHQHVSIHARLCSRAMPCWPWRRASRMCVFQSTPGFAAGRCRCGVIMAAHASSEFQSTPGFAAGRCFTLTTHCCQSKFFAPAANLSDG